MTGVEHPDLELIRQFESAALPAAAWHHAQHIRIGWLMLERHGEFGTALDAVRAGIKKLNAAHGTVDGPGRGYHETMTHAFLRLIDSARRNYGREADSAAFVEAHPELARYCLRLFYSRGRIMSEEARARFVEPDLAALPG